MNKRISKYTRLTLKKLVEQAKGYGIDVSFAIDMDGKYVIIHKITSVVPGKPHLSTYRDDVYQPDTVAMAHWLITGMIAQFRGHNTAYGQVPLGDAARGYASIK